MKKKVYYAHFMGLYNTFQEARDIQLLEGLGFEVVNPNKLETSELFQATLKLYPNSEDYNKAFDLVFGELIRSCDLVAYKPLPDGKISGGVAIELDFAELALKPVICLPNKLEIMKNRMTGEETRAYLRDMGVR